MLLGTPCPHCHKTTPFKHTNACAYWYCFYCKGPLPLQDLTQLNSLLREQCTEKFPSATHFIRFEALKENDSPTLLITLPTLAGRMTQKEMLEGKSGALVFHHETYLGKVYLSLQ